MAFMVLSMLIGGCLTALPFLVSPSWAGHALNAILTPEFKKCRLLRLLTGTVLWLLPLAVGIYFLLFPIMPGSSTIYVTVSSDNLPIPAAGELRVAVAPITPDNVPDSSRLCSGSLAPSGSFRCTINFRYFEFMALVRVEGFNGDSTVLSKAVRVSPISKAGFFPTSVDLSEAGEGDPLSWGTDTLPLLACGAVFLVLMLLFYRGARSSAGKPAFKRSSLLPPRGVADHSGLD